MGGGVVGRPRWYLGSRNTAAPVSYVRVRRFIVPPWSILVAGGLNLGRSKRRVGLEALGAVSKLATVKHKFVKRNPWLANRKTPVAAMPLAGDSVVLLTAGGGYVFADCKTGIKLRISKANCKADSLISSQYGALFAVAAEGKLMPASRNILDPCALLAGNRRMSSMHSGSNDNRYLNDDNKAQIVNPMTLQAMKTRGDSGLAIIEALAFGSSTWGVKTKYSKTKWLKRKAKKYMPWVQVLEPTAFVLAEAYFTRMTKHKEAVRPDVIAQLLARSNTRPGSRVVVMDTFHGVVLSAVAELVGPQGKTIFSPSDLQAPMKTVSKADVHCMGQRASLPKVINLKTRNAEAADVIQNCEIAPRLQHFPSKVDALVATERISIFIFDSES